jgi:SAM-dependent methyltransferase
VGPKHLDELVSFLSTVRIVADSLAGDAFLQPEAELDGYYKNHALVYLRALKILREAVPAETPLKVLELGAAPYFFTALVKTCLPCELTAVSVPVGIWPGAPLRARRESVKLQAGKIPRQFEIEVHVLNIEKDPFPFPDDFFDLVLCMEVIEHLTYSPSDMLAETHRVLTEAGNLFITVPNAINIKRTLQLLVNETIEHRYSGYGVYGRHNREYAPHELEALLAACNYQVVLLQTANVWREIARSSSARRLANVLLNALTSVPVPYLRAKREYVFALAKPVGEPKASYPGFLYDFRHGYASRT